MAITPGTRLGAFEITSQIGAGGMGEVYRATDSNLKRQVAIKVLPASVAADADRLARFQREAEVLAALNHPNIAAIHGLEKTPDFTALVMELVEGDDLSQRIARGAMPIDEALPIAKQIAEALEAAHEQGIIHRDLKPANIKVREDGTVKVLDFGLAKALDPAAASSPGLSMSPTITTPAMTQAGMILGTAAYMAPEQARGKVVDRRADIWAFGAVLFEMLAGRRPFDGEDTTEVLGAVVRLDPQWDVLPATVPARITQVLRACLQKDPKRRLGDMQSLRLALEGAFEMAAPPAAEPRPGTTSAPAGKLPWAVALVSLVAAGTLLMLWAPWRSVPTSAELRFEMPLQGSWFISPDGQRIAIVTSSQPIAIREMNDPEPRVLPLTHPHDAFAIWSPDSRSIAYLSTDFKLVKAGIDGSPPVHLADLTALVGGSWSDEGEIILGMRKGGLQRVPAAGGALTPLTTIAPGQTAHALPQFIGGGRFLYATVGEETNSGIYLASLTDPNGKLILTGDFGSRGLSSFAYVPPTAGAADGYILYTTQNVLLAQAVDPSSLAPKGGATTIAHDAQWLSASLTGTLAYAPDNAGTNARSEWRWLDRTGKESPDVPGAMGGGDATISPSGTRWARSLQGDIWLHGLLGAPSRFTFESTDDRFFTWSPDDQWIAYATGTGRAHDRIMRLNTVTPSTPEALVSGGTDLQSHDWSRDGRFLLFTDAGTSTGWDMFTLDLQTKGAKPVPYLQTPASERFGAFSPDGRWIAYQADESGQLEVYVQFFPAGAGKFQVSTKGGMSPRWRADGRELYFRSAGNLTAVSIQTSPRFEAGVPKDLFSAPVATSGTTRSYDVSPDGNLFLMAMPTSDRRDPSATVIVNWQSALNMAGRR